MFCCSAAQGNWVGGMGRMFFAETCFDGWSADQVLFKDIPQAGAQLVRHLKGWLGADVFCRAHVPCIDGSVVWK